MALVTVLFALSLLWLASPWKHCDPSCSPRLGVWPACAARQLGWGARVLRPVALRRERRRRWPSISPAMLEQSDERGSPIVRSRRRRVPTHWCEQTPCTPARVWARRAR
eukprot:2239421-Rhodomonas_salina.1